MSDESEGNELTGAAARAADLLRGEFRVRPAWRDELLARIEHDEREIKGRRGWMISPSIAIAAAIALVMLGAGGALLFDRQRTAQPMSERIALTQSVRFVLVAPGAGHVSVVGDFNQWTSGAAPLRQLDDGRTWVADLSLAPGRYAYAFVVDGKVVIDPAAPHSSSDDFGVANSIVMVRGS